MEDQVSRTPPKKNIQISQRLTARQVAHSLFPPLFENGDEDYKERLLRVFLLWPPDLFAFTSHILSTTGAYQLVVSPPSSKFFEIIGEVKDHLAHCGMTPEDCNRYLFHWPPKIDVTDVTILRDERGEVTGYTFKETKYDYSWSDDVRQIGHEWRRKLQNGFYKQIIEEFKHGSKEIQEAIEEDRMGIEEGRIAIEEVRAAILNAKLGEGQQDGEWLPQKMFQLWNLIQNSFTTDEDSSESIFDILCNEDDEVFHKKLTQLHQKYMDDLEKLKSHRRQDSIESEEYRCSIDNIDAQYKEEKRKISLKYANKLIPHWFAFQALISLHAIADEACVGLGIRSLWLKEEKEKGSPFRKPKEHFSFR